METLHAGYVRFGIIIVNYVQCDGVCFVMFFKQSLDSVFAISVLIKVSRLVFKHVPALAGNALSH